MTTQHRQAKVTLYNTISLDGMIANPSQEFDWLAADYSLDEFFKHCQQSDAVVMGRKAWASYTTNQMMPLHAKTLVFTNQPLNDQAASSVTGTAEDAVAMLEAQGTRNILLVGGTQTNDLFLQAGCIDEFVFDIQPVFLGSGLPLFHTTQRPPMALIETKQIGSVLHARYRATY